MYRKLRRKCGWLCGFLAALVVVMIYTLHTDYGIFDRDQTRCNPNLERTQNIRYLINTITPILEQYNVTYWLDFGTALGAYRYCDVISFDYDGDIAYLLSDHDKLQQSLEEIRRVPGITVKPDPIDIHYTDARVDIRGFRKVRKWSPTALYHQLIGDYENEEDFYLYLIINTNPSFNVFMNNQLMHKIPYSLLTKRRKVKFGNSCAYVTDDLESLVKLRYPFSYKVEVQMKQRCFGKFKLPPVCEDFECKIKQE